MKAGTSLFASISIKWALVATLVFVCFFGVAQQAHATPAQAQAVISSIYTITNGGTDPYTPDQAKISATCNTGDNLLGGGAQGPTCDIGSTHFACGKIQYYEGNYPVAEGTSQSWVGKTDLATNATYDTTKNIAICAPNTAAVSNYFTLYTVKNISADIYSLDQARTQVLCNAGDTVISGGGAGPSCDQATNPACGKIQYVESNGPITVGSQEGWLFQIDAGAGNAIYDTVQTRAVCLHKTAQFNADMNLYRVTNASTDFYALDQNKTTAMCNAGDIAIGGGGRAPLCSGGSTNPACNKITYWEQHQKYTSGSQQGWSTGFDVIANNPIWDTTATYVTCIGAKPAAPTIACTTSAQCGTDGFVGSPVCQGGAVYRDFKTFTCLNPGMANSSCTNSINTQLQNTCANTCSNGACVTSTTQCSDGIDNDSDGKTDYPVDPGCSSYQDSNESNGANQCVIVRASTYKSGPKYATLPANLPANITVRDLDIFQNTLTAADMQGAKLFIYGDSNLGHYGHQDFDLIQPGHQPGNPYRTLTAAELAAAQQAFNNGLNFTFAADNPTSDEASAGTRQLLNFIQNSVQYSGAFVGAQSGVHYPNTTTYPFMAGKVFDFSNVGLLSPGDLVSVSSPATCAFSLSGRCHATWMPAAGTKGFVFAEGNAGVGSQNYLTNFINMACTPTPTIACTTSAQCGTNGVTGSAFCNGNSVYQNFTTYTCNNAGTASSSCSNAVTQQLQNNCLSNQTCNSGICSTNTTATIACTTNAQCGTNAYVGSPFCQGNAVYQNFQTFTCQNAGTSSSYCSPATNAQFQSTCAFGQTCSGSSCITPTTTCTSHSYQQCLNGSVHWFNSCGSDEGISQACTGNQTCQGNVCINQIQTQGSAVLTKTVRNLSSGNLNWANSVSATPSDVVQFNVTVTAGSATINNLTIRDTLPANLTYNSNLTLDGVPNSGNLTSGLYIGTVIPGQPRTVTYQAQVAGAQSFSFGTTTLTNSATVTSTDSGFIQSTASAQVVVIRQGVLGASTVPTGLTNNPFIDSFFIPLMIALLGIWLWRSGFVGVPSWVGSMQSKNKEGVARKQLEGKIAEIKQKETVK